jgi:DNA-directed RNA polymerase subunit beta
MATPAFDGADETEIRAILKEAGLPETGQTALRDGRTGEFFENEVTVGIMYMLKQSPMVADIIQARTVGPYSTIAQQPLSDKTHCGGQSLGEMEALALEAHGAAYSLQEFMTVKSDDVIGRSRMNETIYMGHCSWEPGLPESFIILAKELQAMGFDIELLSNGKPYNYETAIN